MALRWFAEKFASSTQRTTAALLLAAVLLHLILALPVVATKRLLEHDEALGYLAARGRLDDAAQFEEASERQIQFQPAGRVQALLTSPTSFDFDEVRANLAEHDIHPPAYFGIVGVSLNAWGFNAAVGTAVNLALDLLAIALVFRLARFLLSDRRAAAFATLLWSVSPGVLAATTEARQYSLLGLAAVLFACGCEGVSREPGARRGAWACCLAFATTWGLFTSYQFIVLVAVAAGVFVFQRGRDVRLAGCVGLGAGGLPWLADWQNTLACFRRQQEFLPDFAARDVPDRVVSVLAAPAQFLVVHDAQAIIVTAVGAAVVISLLRRHGLRFSEISLSVRVALGSSVAFLLLFSLFRSPSWALSAKYLSWSYPWLACGAIHVATRISPARLARNACLLACWSLVNSAWASGRDVYREHRAQEARGQLDAYRTAVIDHVSRGNVFANAIELPPTTPLLVASPELLRRKQAEWAPEVNQHTLWIHVNRSSFRAEELASAVARSVTLSKRFAALFRPPRVGVYQIAPRVETLRPEVPRPSQR